jgi:hypothetical protein
VVDEETVCRTAFELIFAFDEVRRLKHLQTQQEVTRPAPQVISLGHKENVTLAQVRTYTEMESHEEKLHKMIIQSKINDTKDLMKRKAMEIDKSKVERKLERGFGGGGGGGGGGATGFGGGISSSSYFGEDGARGGSAGSRAAGGGPAAPANDGFAERVVSGVGSMSLGKGESRAVAPTKGLVLGRGGGKTNAFLEALRAEGENVEADAPAPRGVGGGGATAAPSSSRPPAGSAESVSIHIDEKISCQLKNDGGLESLEVQGTMMLEIHNDEDAFCRVQVAPLSAAAAGRGTQFKTHPNIDKALHAGSNVLALKDASRPFPTGSALGILKWRCAPKDESAVPLTVNCWPSISGALTYLSLEYESTASFDLHNVVITIPLPASREPPNVTACDGDFRADVRKGIMTWTIDLIDAGNKSGSMEFSVPAAEASSFFPIDISFSSRATYCGVEVGGVVRTADGAPVKHVVKTVLSTDTYTVA